MFSRRHPVAMDWWGAGRWRRGVLWLLVWLIVISLVAVLSPAGDAAAHGNGPLPRYDLTYSVFSLSCYGIYHVVRAGETIYSIARMYESTAYRIRYCNGLASYTVYTGQALLVPIYRSR